MPGDGKLLPVGYFHLVFSVPHALVPLIWQNKRHLFGLLFDASAATQEFLRRFLQHVLPKGLPRIRYFGWFANRGAGSCCRFAVGYSTSHLRLLKRTPLQPLSGGVRSAVAQCALWSC